MNNVSRQKSVQLNKALKLVSRSTSRASKEPPMWVSSHSEKLTTAVVKGQQIRPVMNLHPKNMTMCKLLTNLPPKNMMARRWCSYTSSSYPESNSNMGKAVNQSVSLSEALIQINGIGNRTAFMTQADLTNAKRVVTKMGSSVVTRCGEWRE